MSSTFFGQVSSNSSSFQLDLTNPSTILGNCFILPMREMMCPFPCTTKNKDIQVVSYFWIKHYLKNRFCFPQTPYIHHNYLTKLVKTGLPRQFQGVALTSQSMSSPSLTATPFRHRGIFVISMDVQKSPLNHIRVAPETPGT